MGALLARSFGWCVYGLIAVAAVRTTAYLLYVGWLVPFPLEVHALEATMVHHAWRVRSGAPLYQMEQWLESRSYDYLVLTADLYDRGYDDYAFGLPHPLVQKARGRYRQVGYAAGLFIYQPRPGS